MVWEQASGNSAGSMNGDGSRKLLLHSTEGTSVEGALGAYLANNSWPTFTVDCRKRRVVRHLPDTVAARSLRNRSGGVETNRDGSILIQIELMGFAGTPESIGDHDDLVWLGTEVVGPLCRRNDIPIVSSVRWAPYPASYGENASQRLTAAQWDAYSGILGHQHAPENTHGDPGAIDIETILSAARGEEDDMPLTNDDVEKIATKIRFVLNEGTAAGQRTWADTSKATLASGQHNTNLLNALAGAVGRIDQVDEDALAAALAPLLEAQVRTLSDSDLLAVADAVADEQHRRSEA